MEKRIRKRIINANGGYVGYVDYVVDFGKTIQSCLSPTGIGYTMSGFLVYQSSCYDTLEEAEKAEYRA